MVTAANDGSSICLCPHLWRVPVEGASRVAFAIGVGQGSEALHGEAARSIEQQHGNALESSNYKRSHCAESA